jgi:AcrR family transcriptional regulator
MTRRQPPEARRQQILGAATSLLLANGLAGTSVDAVARRAGIAKGTIYLYFPSRHDLLAAVRARYAHGLASCAEGVLGHADPTSPAAVTGAFDRLAAELLGYTQANRRLYHILFHESGGPEDDLMSPLQSLVLGFLTQAMEQRALMRTDPGLLARFLLAGLHAVLLPLAHQDPPARQHTPTSLSDLLHRLLAPATSAQAR